MNESTVLIESVRERQPLWNTQDPRHNDRKMVAHLWQEVAGIIGGSREMAKSRWRSLRDYYRHEQRKALASRDPDLYHSTWSHYHRMHFLKDSFNPKTKFEFSEAFPDDPPNFKIENSSSNLACDSVHEPVLQFEVDETAVFQQNHASVSPPLSLGSQNSVKMTNSHEIALHASRRGSRKRCIVSSDCLAQKLVVLEKLVEDNDNDDLQFFKSLVPDLKELPRKRKAYIRLKIQELIYSEVYGNEPNTEAVKQEETE